MTIDLTEEELTLVIRCLQTKNADYLANYFDPKIQDAGLQNRNRELYEQSKALLNKLGVRF